MYHLIVSILTVTCTLLTKLCWANLTFYMQFSNTLAYIQNKYHQLLQNNSLQVVHLHWLSTSVWFRFVIFSILIALVIPKKEIGEGSILFLYVEQLSNMF